MNPHAELEASRVALERENELVDFWLREGLGTRAARALAVSGVSTLQQLRSFDLSKLKAVRQVGPTTIREIRAFASGDTHKPHQDPAIAALEHAWEVLTACLPTNPRLVTATALVARALASINAPRFEDIG